MVDSAPSRLRQHREGDASDLPMLADLRRQAMCLATLAGRYSEFFRLGQTQFGNAGGRIIAFGSGDGWFAARAAAAHAQQDLGLAYEAASSLETLSYVLPRHLNHELAGVAISMSGSADRTNEAAEALRRSGKPVLALTNGGGGELARITGRKISLELTDLAPFLTGTTKYTTTLLGLIMLLEGAAHAKASLWIPTLDRLPDLLPEVERFSQELAEGFVGRPPTGVRILSAGPNLATAEYGMAKLIKLLPLPAWADEVEEFAHRQFWSCPATDLIIYVAANPAVARCASASAAALGSMGMLTVAIDTPSCPVSDARMRFTLPDVPENVSPLFAAVALQYIGYYLALAFGANPDQSQDIGDPARFRAAQLLARRGELAANH
jgi:glucosamine 6-phosphate synthetase-like amidotransferase/phosphosugar isomerase protein